MSGIVQLEHSVPGALGPWRLGASLGEGGMGQVFSAEHRDLGRRAAIKVLHPHLASDPELVRRFFAEARVVNEINHEHIVEIHDFVADPRGASYFVMELLDGRSLAEVRRAGPLTLARTVAIARQICTALQAAHDKGVVHRDLKPENVMLIERDGQPDFVKLLDFGVAKVPSAAPDAPRTIAGMILGTPEYMSPEQAGGRTVDHRSDIYSLGVLLHWMIAGGLPFQASGFDKLAVLRLTRAPPRLPSPTPSGERLPSSLARLVTRCLALEPADRFQTMSEVGDALGRLAAELEAPRGSRRAPLAFWAGAAVLGIAAFGLWAGRRHPHAVGAPGGLVPEAVAAPAPPAALPPLPKPAARPPAEAHRSPMRHQTRRAPSQLPADPNAVVNPYEE